tara:strand:+ start:1844 stop:2581 length:738 start_codon:yes stop_codon:yes gene_type:complete
MFSIKNFEIIVTGGASGIGKEISLGLINQGASITILDIKKPILNVSKEFNFINCDLGDIKSIKKALTTCYKKIKYINGLVNCAGITISKEALNYNYADWIKTININLTGPFFLCQEVAKKMIKDKVSGSIVNFTSIGAEEGFENNPAYAASKGGLKTLTKSLATEWGKYNIRLNNIVPGYTNTPMNKKSWNDKKSMKKRAERTSLNRWAKPEEMLGSTIFLLSSESSYVTGSDLIVDGGWTSKGM